MFLLDSGTLLPHNQWGLLLPDPKSHEPVSIGCRTVCANRGVCFNDLWVDRS